jgi:hypothetical protein
MKRIIAILATVFIPAFLVGMFIPLASAHTAIITPGCNGLAFVWNDFPSGTTTITFSVKDHTSGSTVASGSFPITGSSGNTTVSYPALQGTHTLDASASWTVTENGQPTPGSASGSANVDCGTTTTVTVPTTTTVTTPVTTTAPAQTTTVSNTQTVTVGGGTSTVTQTVTSPPATTTVAGPPVTTTLPGKTHTVTVTHTRVTLKRVPKIHVVYRAKIVYRVKTRVIVRTHTRVRVVHVKVCVPHHGVGKG